jgi:hydrogenase nickel incorporation protein HypA/HybF
MRVAFLAVLLGRFAGGWSVRQCRPDRPRLRWTMHEYSIVSALLARVEAEARAHGAEAVHRIRVRIGELSGVERDLLVSAYELARERTLCEKAELEIVPVEARWVCSSCKGAIPKGAVLRCSVCDLPAQLAEGDEILLERVEMEVADV